MAAREALLPAPGRGQYDRRQPRERRLAEQRERIIAATGLALASETSPSVATIVRRAGVGRNTFYEYFDDVSHAVEAAGAAVLRRVEQSLRDAELESRTPVERWRSLARAWLTFAESEPGAMLLVLGKGAGHVEPLSSGGRVLEEALVRSLETLRNAGVNSPPATEERLLGVAAAGEVYARAAARTKIAAALPHEPPPRVPSRAWDREGLERSLVEIAVRLLR